jgi:hypothetical protein
MTVITGSQRLTIFGEDDETPILGTMSGGAVVEPTCSTNPDYLRPYLKTVIEGAEAEINFKEGKAVIGQVTVEILDKRTDPIDQASGWFTALLASGGFNANTQLLGHRALLEQQNADDTWFVVLDGVISSINLLTSLVTYKLALRDIRERERGNRLFVNSQHAIVPWGSPTGYGRIPVAGGGETFIVPPVGGVRCAYNAATKSFNVFESFAISNDYWQLLAPFMYGQLVDDGNGFSQRHTQVVVRWAPWLDEYNVWTTSLPSSFTSIQNMKLGVKPLLEVRRTEAEIRGVEGTGGVTVRSLIRINIDDTAGTVPANGQLCWVQLVSNLQPTPEAPLYLSLTFGQLLKNAYDGVYSDPGSPVIRYDPIRMAAFAAKTPIANLVKQEVVDDRRAWIEEHIYKPLGYAPALDELGRVVPIKYSLPDEDTPLLALDDSNVISAEWSHDQSEVVTKVEFTYHRDYGIDGKVGNFQSLQLKTREIIHQRISVDSILLGEKVINYEPDTVRSISNQVDGEANDGNVQSELGAQLAMRRGLDAINRFSKGAQRINVKARRGQAGIQDAKVGDWVTVGVSWLPDYVSGTRGINRLGQIIKIKNMGPSVRDFVVLDAGPLSQPLENATVVSVQPNNTTGQIEATVTAIPSATPGMTVRVEFEVAISPTEPDNDAGEWSLMGIMSNTGIVKSQVMPPSTTCWVRWRCVAEGRRPSTWSTAEDVTFTATPSIKNVRTSIDPETGNLLVLWSEVSNVLGVRIFFKVQDPFEEMPSSFTQFVDADVADGSRLVDLGGIPNTQVIYVQVVPFAGFSGGACTGASGRPSRIMQETRIIITSGPAIGIREITSETDSVGTLVIEVTDPTTVISRVVFKKTAGRNAPVTETVFSPGPYTVQVDLFEKLVSSIEYTVRGNDASGGQDQILAQGKVPFIQGAKPVPPVWQRTFDADGNGSLLVLGDSDTKSIRIGVSLTSAAQARLSEGENFAVNGREVTFADFVTALDLEADVFVAIRAYSGLSGTGLASDYVNLVLNRGNIASFKTARYLGSSGVSFQGDTSGFFNIERSKAGIALVRQIIDGGTESFTALGHCIIVLPFGAVLTEFRAKVTGPSNSAVGDVDIELRRITTGSDTLLDSASVDPGSTETVVLGSLNEDTDDRGYLASFDFNLTKNASFPGVAASVHWIEVDYDVPTLAVGI